MLAPWHPFYSIVGTAAATLTGLMFVVVTLIAQLQARMPSPRSGMRFFNTSNVLHFGAALLVAAILSAPWPALWEASLLLGLAGLAGVAYVLFMVWEAAYHRLGGAQSGYQLVLSDWLWYTLLPLVSYAALVVVAVLLASSPVLLLFVIAAASMLLLFIGIHNAWDLVTFLLIDYPQLQKRSQD